MLPLHDRAERLGELLADLKERFPAVWKPLTSALLKGGHFRRRARLAQLRVVAPLLDHEDSSEIERAPSEFTTQEIKAFLAAGVTRERILLDRQRQTWGYFTRCYNGRPL